MRKVSMYVIGAGEHLGSCLCCVDALMIRIQINIELQNIINFYK